VLDVEHSPADITISWIVLFAPGAPRATRQAVPSKKRISVIDATAAKVVTLDENHHVTEEA
jgi:hypothetical protein